MNTRFGWIILATATWACDRTPTSSPASPPSGAPGAPLASAPASASASAAVTSKVADASAEGAVASSAIRRTFDDDPVGAAPPGVASVIGEWSVAERQGARGLLVDGSHWRSGTPSASLADQAKRLYGERYAEFLDGVKAFAFFPLAVDADEIPKGDFRARVRFYPIAGQIDQAAGIAFGIAADGSYFGVRANALEDNILYFKVVKGQRTVLDTVRAVPTATRTWHTLAVELHGKRLTVELDGKVRFDKALDAAPAGKFGLWSKADSVVLFDDWSVEPAS